MLIWSFVLFGLGVLAVLDSQFNYGQIFRSANSIMYMLLSLGILIRAKLIKTRGYREQLVRRNIELEEQVKGLQHSLQLLEQKTEQEKVPA